MTGKPRTAVCWLRRDLRLHDHLALLAAAEHAERVIPLFVIDPQLLAADDVAPQRVAFLGGALRSLAASLATRGSRLVVRHGHPATEVATFARSVDAMGVFAEEDWWPYARQRDREVAATVPLHLCAGLTVHHPASLVKPDGSPYRMFTPFRRAWLARPLPRPVADGLAVERLAAALAAGAVEPADDSLPAERALAVLPEPAMAVQAAFPASEAEALARLWRFVSGEEGTAAIGEGTSRQRRPGAASGNSRPPIADYGAGRDRLDVQATSQLSPYLRFGMVSPRLAVAAARQAAEPPADEAQRTSAQRWLDELIWREFYQYVLYWFPSVLEGSFRADLAGMAWTTDAAAFAAWCDGQTGYPVVDAAMRALVTTGWLHNRGRMIVASFLTKDLLIDWRRGEHFFMRHLLDGDPAANNGGWQWTAGTGTDAAPYFRVFHPVLQGRRHDPHGLYVRTWMPELRAVPTEYVHTPWQMPTELQRHVGCIIGRDYPAPIVDHDQARQRALAAYGQARSMARGNEAPLRKEE